MDLTQHTTQTRHCYVDYSEPGDIQAGADLLSNRALMLAPQRR
jgi:hypothetical protein